MAAIPHHDCKDCCCKRYDKPSSCCCKKIGGAANVGQHGVSGSAGGSMN